MKVVWKIVHPDSSRVVAIFARNVNTHVSSVNMRRTFARSVLLRGRNHTLTQPHSHAMLSVLKVPTLMRRKDSVSDVRARATLVHQPQSVLAVIEQIQTTCSSSTLTSTLHAMRSALMFPFQLQARNVLHAQVHVKLVRIFQTSAQVVSRVLSC